MDDLTEIELELLRQVRDPKWAARRAAFVTLALAILISSDPELPASLAR